MRAGESGLLHATTGSGKTYAVWFGALARAFALGAAGPQAQAGAPGRTGGGAGQGSGAAAAAGGVATTGTTGARDGTDATDGTARKPKARAPKAPPLGILWITPMRALAADTTRALDAPLADLGLAWRVGQRTGDTAPAERARQDRRLPAALVTTPESLSLLLTREDAAVQLGGVHTVIVDEWHELMGSKRGVQVQLALARLRRWSPGLVTWGLSATLGNLEEAMRRAARRGGAGRQDGARPRREVARHRHPAAGRPRPLLVGRPPRQADARPGGGGDRRLVDDARLRQHALAGRGLVPDADRGAARLGRAGRAAPRLARPRDARLGRAGAEGGPPEGGRRHLVARPRGRLPAGRARAADRLAQGRRPAGAARRQERPRAGAAEPRHAGADQHARAGRGGGGAARRARRPRREPHPARQAARRAGAAPGDGGARRRLRRRRALRRGARRPRLPRAGARGVRLGARLRRAAAARACTPIPSTTACGATRRASGACPTGRSAGATGCRSAPSSPARRCR